MTNIDRYAVFGNPIAHSKSPLMHMAFAKQTQQSINYDAKCVEVGHFVSTAEKFFHTGGRGLNITVPFKQDAFRYAQQLTSRAKLAGAVNTLAVQANGSILGDNTDGAGMIMDMRENLQWPLQGTRVLLLGAGGAVRGVLGPLLEAQVKSITIVNRTLSKATALVDMFRKKFSNLQASTYEQLGNQPFDIIINGTSTSLTGGLPPVTKNILTTNSCCYDMVYSKDLTPFLHWASHLGVKKLSDGLGMLVYQGAESFYRWRNVKPDALEIIKHLRVSL